MLFTESEKKAAYRRIISGNRARGSAMLSHIMAGRYGVVRDWAAFDPVTANKVATIYRLVERGMIVTVDQFNEKSEIMLNKKDKTK